MFHLKKNKKIVQFIVISMLLNNPLLAESIKYEFKFIKLLEQGKKKNFEPQNDNFDIENYTLKKNINSKYPFYLEVEKEDVGKKIKLKVRNEKDWIIIFPNNGEFVVPKMPKGNKVIKINIKMIRKYTEIYFDIFGEYEYSVQVYFVSNKDVALQKIQDLQKIKKLNKEEGNILCTNDIRQDIREDVYYEAVPIIPHRGYKYKVKIGHYSNEKQALKVKNCIRNLYPNSLYESFITARLINRD